MSAFRRALAPVDGTVVVVDDASSDDTARVAADAGAEVIQLDRPSGPYVARNRGWCGAPTDHVVFVDVRCRPRGAWPAGLVEALSDPGVAIAAGDVHVVTGPTLAARAAADLQALSSANGRANPFLAYAPTCHLATRLDVLEAIDGFRPVRGGGDVDFCWRAQLAQLGSVAFVDDAVVDWVPRERLRDLLGQFHRYGANNRRLVEAYHPHGCPVPAAPPTWRVAVHEARAALRSGGNRPPLATRLASAAARLAMASGYRSARDSSGGPLGPRPCGAAAPD